MTEVRRQSADDPSSLCELGASPFGLRPHKTPRQAEVKRRTWLLVICYSLLEAIKRNA